MANAQRDLANLVRTLGQGKNDMASYRADLAEIDDRLEAGRKTGRLVFAAAPRASSEAYDYATVPADTKQLLDLVLNHASVPQASIALFDNYVHDSLAGFYIKAGRTELNMPVLATYGYLRYRGVFNITGKHRQECIDPSTLPPGKVPDIGTAFQQLGTAMGGF